MDGAFRIVGAAPDLGGMANEPVLMAARWSGVLIMKTVCRVNAPHNLAKMESKYQQLVG